MLGGSGLSWQDGKVYEVREGDCIVHRAGREAHTLRGGDDGLDVLVVRPDRRRRARHAPARRRHLARVELGRVRPGRPSWDQEAEAGEPEVGEPAERPKNIVNVDDLEQERWIDLRGRGRVGAKSGLHRRDAWAPATLPVPAHCHSAEEEIFVVLDGDGTLELVPAREPATAVTRRSTSRFARVMSSRGRRGTRSRTSSAAATNGMKVLDVRLGRTTNDITYYPRSNKIGFRGVGLIARLEPLDYGTARSRPASPARPSD